jgi:hypothetical protein
MKLGSGLAAGGGGINDKTATLARGHRQGPPVTAWQASVPKGQACEGTKGQGYPGCLARS